MKRIVVVIILSLVLVSCGSKKKASSKKKSTKPRTERVIVKPNDTKPVDGTTPTTPKTSTSTIPNSTEAYILQYADIAMEEMRKYKIPASITLAQGILESGSGKGRLAVEANNHFGIKCHGWTGEKIYHDDDASQECFRKYPHADQSFEDHSTFLTSRGRYADLFKLDLDDYEGWAKGLRAAGYATDRKYPEKLISLIERFQLYKYDDAVLGTPSKPKSSKNTVVSNEVTTHEVVKGDTLYSLSKKYNTTVEALQKLNNLKGVDISLGQVLRVK